MLVITRKVGETIRIGPNIHVTVLRQNNGQVKLGVDAPRDMVIVREETERPVAVN